MAPRRGRELTSQLPTVYGQQALATASVQCALGIWKSADPGYRRIQEAQELLHSLSG